MDVIVYHANCADGVVSTWIRSRYIKERHRCHTAILKYLVQACYFIGPVIPALQFKHGDSINI
jgi:hypothetical protein